MMTGLKGESPVQFSQGRTVVLLLVVLLVWGPSAQGDGLPAGAAYVPVRSVAPGEQLPIHATAPQPEATLRIYREGPIPIEVHTERLTSLVPGTADRNAVLWGCGWPVATTVTVGGDWSSGIYRVQVGEEAPQHPSHQTLFVVRPETPGRVNLLYVVPTLTHHAASTLGGPGYRRYSGILERMSLHRPTGVDHFETYERPLVQWLTGNNFQVDFIADEDLPTYSAHFEHYAAMILPPLVQYVTDEAREAIVAFRDRGGDVLHLGAHSLTNRIRLLDDAYQTFPGVDADPGVADGLPPAVPFRDVGKGEDAFFGSRWEPGFTGAQTWPFRVADGGNFVFDGLDVTSGDVFHLPLMGGVWDRLGPAEIPGLTVLGNAHLDVDGPRLWREFPTTVAYRHDPDHGHPEGRGAHVFSAGTALWPRGLWNAFGKSDHRIETVTMRLIDDATGQRPAPYYPQDGPRVLFGGTLTPWHNPKAGPSQWVVGLTAPGDGRILTGLRLHARPPFTLWEQDVIEQDGVQVRLLEGDIADGPGYTGVEIGTPWTAPTFTWPWLVVRGPREPAPMRLSEAQRQAADALFRAVHTGTLPGITPNVRGFYVRAVSTAGTDLNGGGGDLVIAAAVHHPEGPKAIATATAMVWGQPVLELQDTDLDGIWEGQRRYHTLPEGRYPLSVVARDVYGKASLLWPGIAVGEEAGFTNPYAKDVLTARERLFVEQPLRKRWMVAMGAGALLLVMLLGVGVSRLRNTG